MAVNDEKFDAQIKALIGTAAVNALVSAVMSGLTSLLVTNYTKRSLEGNKTVAPTDDLTVLDKKEATGSETDGSLAKDETAAQKGDIDAAITEAQASESSVKAATAGTQAVETAAGASEIATKGLKMN